LVLNTFEFSDRTPAIESAREAPIRWLDEGVRRQRREPRIHGRSATEIAGSGDPDTYTWFRRGRRSRVD
jgi:hypothetical protein